MSSPSIFRQPLSGACDRSFVRKAIGDCQSFLRFQDKLLFFACQCTDAPDPDRDAIGVGSRSEGRIKMISTSDQAFENGHATPLEARTHFGRDARQRGNSDVTNLVIVGRSAAGSRLLASRFYGYPPRLVARESSRAGCHLPYRDSMILRCRVQSF